MTPTTPIVVSMMLITSIASAVPVFAADPAGRALAHHQEKGNCLACHRMPLDPGAETLANIGPALSDIKRRYPDRAALRAQIWDASAKNPETIMPPYGRHRILTEAEIDLVTDYVHGL